jgi:hypothetical protein
MTVTGLLWLVTSASAQPVATFADLPVRLNIGDKVSVEDRSGAVTSGRLDRLTPEELAVTAGAGTARVFPAASVRRVQRRGDSLGNGMRVGAIVGGVLGGALGGWFSGEFRASDFMQGAAIFGAVGLGLGLALDAAHVGHTTVFTAPTTSAGSGPHGGGRIALHATLCW